MRVSLGSAACPACVALLLFSTSLTAQKPAAHKPEIEIAKPAAASASMQNLPVRKVVLYKSGVGYFEHAGAVNGNQKVSIDFTASQLNDVLQSLTVLDDGGGRVAGVNYNSTTPLDEQLKSLSLGMDDDPTSTELFQALRGQRVEVTGAPGGALTGRLMSIEQRNEKVGETAGAHFYLTLVTSANAVRVVELLPSLSVRPLDAALQGQLDRYLELLATTRSTGLRHLTLNALGAGSRQLRVSYISEVPVWKSTYRFVFPKALNSKATVQGWAVVDNTVGADWENVQFSLVAGAPQSFIQPLSQPIYTHRPQIAIATVAQVAPETHEASVVSGEDAEVPVDGAEASATLNSEQVDSAILTGRSAAELVKIKPGITGRAKDKKRDLDRIELTSGLFTPSGVNRVSDALQAGDVSSSAFDDFFEYSLTQPVTIHKNESAMVPILQADYPTEHVTLWSAHQRRPLRAVWLTNDSKLTLDAGSFSIFENGEFAGEGLLDPLHPGEKRLMSYAVDQAIQVNPGADAQKRTVQKISLHEGVLRRKTSYMYESSYAVANASDDRRVVIVEHARRMNANLESDVKPVETTANAYRFQVEVAPHHTETLRVKERMDGAESISINPEQRNEQLFVAISKDAPRLLEKLKPLIEAEQSLFRVKERLDALREKADALDDEETRARDNLTALKDKDTARRFVQTLNRAEDDIEANERQQKSAEEERDAAQTIYEQLLRQVAFDEEM